MSNLGPHFIAFISRTEEKKDYIELDRNAEFVFASLSSCDPEVVTVDPKCLKDAIAKFSILHAAKPFTAILNRKEKCVVPAAQLASDAPSIEFRQSVSTHLSDPYDVRFGTDSRCNVSLRAETTLRL
jgi:hypothetical protein